MPGKRFPACILATCCLPWNENGTLAEEIFRTEIRNLRNNLTRDLYLFGTAGEGYAVTEKQFDQITEIFWEEMKQPGCRPMVGTISLSLGTILGRIERARSMGFRYFQISLPSWGALGDAELMRFFDAVCGGFPDCFFLHYNLLRAKRLVTAEEYGKLVQRFPNLVATKNSTDSKDRILALNECAPELQHFSTETGFGQAAQIGECGFLISVASMNFQLGKEYFQASQTRDLKKLVEMQQELRDLTKDFIAQVGDAARMDGAYDKFFCKMHDPRFPLRLLPPYLSFSDEMFAATVDFLRKKYPRWVK